jgi:hypothetical protein
VTSDASLASRERLGGVGLGAGAVRAADRAGERQVIRALNAEHLTDIASARMLG